MKAFFNIFFLPISTIVFHRAACSSAQVPWLFSLRQIMFIVCISWKEPVLQHTAGSDTIFIQIYMDVPPGVPGDVKRTARAQGSIPRCVFALIFSPNWTNFEKPHRIKKIYQKWLFCAGFSKFVQFGLNISVKTHQVINPLVLPGFLTPLAPLGARP